MQLQRTVTYGQKQSRFLVRYGCPEFEPAVSCAPDKPPQRVGFQRCGEFAKGQHSLLSGRSDGRRVPPRSEGPVRPQVGPCPDFVERPLLAEAAFEVGACL